MAVAVRSDQGKAQTPPERVELILSHLAQLPTLPAVAGRLLAVTTSDDSCARDVVAIIESDASLTAAILRMVRRADLGVDTHVTTVQRAVTLLGFRAIRNAVLSVQVYTTLVGPGENERLLDLRRELWKHSLAVACTADMLASSIGGAAAAGEAFVCGLLHDVGKIALDVCLPKSFARVVAIVERKRECICDVERELFGLDHTVAGRRLAARWQLPPAIVECVWMHHQDPQSLPTSVANRDLVALIHLADDLVRQHRIGFSGYQHGGDTHAQAARLGIDAAALSQTMADLPARMGQYCALVGLDDSTGQMLYAESVAKANRELGLVNAELAESNRSLELRAACFEALRGFTEHIRNQGRIADVCAAGGWCISSALGTDSALAFVAQASRRCLHAGCSSRSARVPTTAVVDIGDRHNREILGAVVAVSEERRIVTAPEGSDGIWRQCVGSPPPGPLWMLPFIKTDSLIGAVLFAADDEVAARWRNATAECHALSSSIGLAVSTAQARLESESMNDELLDLNRRLREAQVGLVRARSISMIAEMAAGAAHELNNPLSVISGRAQMLLQGCEDEDTGRALKVITEKTHEASGIVTDLMQFAKPSAPQPISQQLGHVLESHCQHWRAGSSLGEQDLTLSLADAGVVVYADPAQLEQILEAVVTNAIEAGKGESSRVNVNSPSRVSDETVRIVVEDNGAGMSPDVSEHAFDPFFSSRPAGRGRGLGLARAYRLAEINGGSLWIESTVNVGTTVTIELPARAPTE